MVRTLLARGLITEVFTDAETGAIHYGTTDALLVNLGIDTVEAARTSHRSSTTEPTVSTRCCDDARIPGHGARGPRTSSSRPRTLPGHGHGDGQAMSQEREGVRLQKVLANAGVASRRVAEQLIVEGRVRVNGRVVTELGSRIDPETDLVDVDGTAIQLDQSKRYVMLNKPRGVVNSMKDERGRPDLRQFTQDWPERLYNVGRLDADTSGLLVLTNDGELAHVLAHPSFGVTKVYIAKVDGRVTPQRPPGSPGG